MSKSAPKIIVILFFIFFTLAAGFLSVKLRNNSQEDKRLKNDYFLVNQIKYGLLSGDKWSGQVNAIIAKQIDSFSFTGQNKRLLTEQINAILFRLLDEANAVLHKKRDNLKDRIKYKVINSFVNVNEFRTEVPRFSKAIVSELDKSKNKEQLKALLKEKVTGILRATSQDTLGEQTVLLQKYHSSSISGFNRLITKKTEQLRAEQKRLAYFLIGILILVLVMWLLIIRFRIIFAVSFMFSVLISFLALFIGVSLPMIEIDARIGRMDLELLSSHIIFNDQVIFFQTKSILDVIHILMINGRADSIFVGCLIFIFSVLFPVTKLISTTVYLFSANKENRFVKYMAFNSGKWSMADVMVVAIFMAYVGFQNILDDQLEDITVHNDTVNLITTNKTNLQAGFLIFVCFVLFNLALAEILKRITRKEDGVQGVKR